MTLLYWVRPSILQFHIAQEPVLAHEQSEQHHSVKLLSVATILELA